MQQNILIVTKRLMISFGVLVLVILVHWSPTSANEEQNEQVDAFTELIAEINYFYLHPNAADFMNNFYTRESLEHLRNTFNQVQEQTALNSESELSHEELAELYQLLHGAVTGLRPIVIRRGESTSQGQEVNFRGMPATETQVLYTLAYGTSFEILEEVQGGNVIGTDFVSSDRWFRIRHNDQSGYVHSRYVRDLPVSETRIQLLADIGRQELWLQSKIDGWRTRFSPHTRSELQEI